MYVLVIAAVAVLLVIIVIRTLLFTSKQVHVEPVTDIALDPEAVQRLSKALQFKTISYQDSQKMDKKEFLGLHNYLEKAFPEVHKTLTKESMSEYSLLYTWKGRSETLKPILLMSHLDVVPVEPGTEKDWVYPAFSGEIKDGYIWGRGSMDIKEGVLSILEAVEHLLKEGFEPERTIYLAFGHDEEVGGLTGAKTIAALLKSRGILLEYVLDEGGAITKGLVPGITGPVALVGVAEKGYISLALTVESEGGHSSMPPKNTAVGILGKAVAALEENKFSGRIQGVVKKMFEYTGPEMSFTKKMIFANLWLFSPLVKHQLAQTPKTDALLRTTTAPTIVKGGTKENVLPTKVEAVVNFRILPGETIETVKDHVKTVINDPRVVVTPLKQVWNPSPVSDLASESYAQLQKTLRQVFPDTVVAPYLVTGATDSRHYLVLTDNVFKIVPIVATPEDLKRAHGTNERILVQDYEKCIKFFIQVIRNSAS